MLPCEISIGWILGKPCITQLKSLYLWWGCCAPCYISVISCCVTNSPILTLRVTCTGEITLSVDEHLQRFPGYIWARSLLRAWSCSGPGLWSHLMVLLGYNVQSPSFHVDQHVLVGFSHTGCWVESSSSSLAIGWRPSSAPSHMDFFLGCSHHGQ